MKIYFLILLCFSTSAHSSNVSGDLKLVHETVKRMDQMLDYYQSDVVPLLERYNSNQHTVFNKFERNKISGFWTELIDHRIILHSLYNSHLKEDNYQTNLLKYTSNLSLQLTGAVLSNNLWNNKFARKKLDETNMSQIPRGSFVNMENELFRNFNHGLASELPTFFPVNNLAKDRHGFYSISSGSKSDIEIELENLNRLAQSKLKSLNEFLTNNQNITEVKKRFLIYKFKNIFYTIVKKISTWLGDTKLKNRNPDNYNGQTLIDIKMAKRMEELVLPGDVMISRTNWFFSNAFLPGFWPHSFLYIGGRDKLSKYFNENSINIYFIKRCLSEGIKCNNLTSYLEKSPNTQEAWNAYMKKDKYGFSKVLIEGTSDGIHFSSIRHTFLNDYLAALRPTTSKLAKAKSIVDAIENYGIEYDFDFDYQTDDRLVCTELVAKAYATNPRKGGFSMNYDVDKKKYLEVITGRLTLPVINFVHKAFEENVLKQRKSDFEFVAFLKGVKSNKSSIFTTEKEFYQSRNWPKWSFMQE